MDKQNVVYTYNGILFNLKKKGNFEYTTTWMNLEDVLSEMSQLKRQIQYDSTYKRHLQ